MNRKILQLLLTGLLALAAFQPAGRPASAAVRLQTDPPIEVLLDNGYRVTFEGVEYHPDDTSTWSYRVEKQFEARNLGYWVLEVPLCAPVLDAGPGDWGRSRANSHLDFNGVRWAADDDYESGEFWVRLQTRGAAGTTRLAVRAGPDTAQGEIAGPTCDPTEPGGTDQQPPSLEWLEPVAQGERYDLPAGGHVELVVTAADNVGVDRVAFLRWDEAAAEYVTMAVDSSAPYTATILADDLVPAWNFITAASTDLAGNQSEWRGIWIYRLEPASAPDSLSLYLPLLIK